LQDAQKTLLYIPFLSTITASFILVPMDENYAANHLKAYGITFWCLDKITKASWLLNYRGVLFIA
jgi:hypothetical protein